MHGPVDGPDVAHLIRLRSPGRDPLLESFSLRPPFVLEVQRGLGDGGRGGGGGGGDHHLLGAVVGQAEFAAFGPREKMRVLYKDL